MSQYLFAQRLPKYRSAGFVSARAHNNQVYAALLGDMVQANAVQSEHYTHLSLLCTVEEKPSTKHAQSNGSKRQMVQIRVGTRTASRCDVPMVSVEINREELQKENDRLTKVASLEIDDDGITFSGLVLEVTSGSGGKL